MKKTLTLLLFCLITAFLSGQSLIRDLEWGVNLGSHPLYVTSLNDTLFFTASVGESRNFYKMAITDNQPLLIEENLDYAMGKGLVFKGAIYFTPDIDNKHPILKSDGTATGTSLFMDIDANFEKAVVTDNHLFFLARTAPTYGYQLWVTDGTTENTFPLTPEYLGNAQSSLYDWALEKCQGGLLYSYDYEGIRKMDSLLNYQPTVPYFWFIRHLKYSPAIDKYFYQKGYEKILYSGDNQGDVSVLDSNFYDTSANVFQDYGNSVLFLSYGQDSIYLKKTDGTTTGTVKLRAIMSHPLGTENFQYETSFLGEANGRAFFSMEKQLWVTDGTSAGTNVIKEFNTLFWGFNLHYTTGNRLFFEVPSKDGYRNSQLWVSDGTTDGTFPIMQDCFYSYIDQSLAVDSMLFFNYESSYLNRELWSLNTNTLETQQVVDLNNEMDVFQDPAISNLTVLGQKAYFSAFDKPISRIGQTWETDGSFEGTKLSFQSPLTAPHKMGDSILLFTKMDCSGNYTLMKMDEEHPEPVFLEALGHNVSDKIHYFDTEENTYFIFGTKSLSSVPFQYSSSGEYQIWKTDGSSQGTTFIKTLDLGIREFAQLGDKIIYELDDQIGVFDMITEEETHIIRDEFVSVGAFKVVGQQLFFYDRLPDDHNPTYGQLWQTDGTSDHTIQLNTQDFWPTGVFPIRAFGQIDQLFLFLGSDDSNQGRLWVTDSTSEGTFIIGDVFQQALSADHIGQTFKIDNKLYFFVKTPFDSVILWRTDGTINGTYRVKSIPSEGTVPDVYHINDGIIFPITSSQGKKQVWTTDGTWDGTKILFQLEEEGHEDPADFTVLGDKVIFTAEIPDSDNYPSRELFQFDLVLKTIAPISEENGHFELYPNPISSAQQQIQLKSNLKEPVDARIRLYDLQGKTLLQKQKRLSPNLENSVQIPKLDAGVYLLNITADGVGSTLRVVVF